MSNRFNLIDEPWIPIADVGLVSLREVFSTRQHRSLGGNPVQKIAVFKLLQAIAQAACTPRDSVEWRALSIADMAGSCLAYLTRWHDHFFLYGSQPFLQMPSIAAAECKSFGTVLAEVATGNTTVLTQGQQEAQLDDADRALLLLVQMGFALAGKKADNSIVLSPGYAGKCNDKGRPSSGRAGPSIGFRGLLHSFVQGETLLDTVLLNLIPHSDIEDSQRYPGGLGNPPWEAMPSGEDCPVARAHRLTLQGRLMPMSRFCLLTEHGLHYSEGIAHPDYKAGGLDPTIAIEAGKDPRVLWVNPARRPWRELTALLSFLQGAHSGFDCMQVRIAIQHARQRDQRIAIWSGGISISNKAGEQFMTGENDYVDSTVWFDTRDLGTDWFAYLRQEFEGLNTLEKMLYACVMAYYKQLKVDGKSHAAQATSLFWQLCERQAQTLIDACNPAESNAVVRRQLRQGFANNLQRCYGQFCPHETARQLDAWASSLPHPQTYLHEELA